MFIRVIHYRTRQIFNKFLSAFKFVTVTTIFKQRERTFVSNYRLISWLKYSKKIMQKRLNKFLDKNQLLLDLHYKCRQNMSTQDAIKVLIGKIYNKNIVIKCYPYRTYNLFLLDKICDIINFADHTVKN